MAPLHLLGDGDTDAPTLALGAAPREAARATAAAAALVRAGDDGGQNTVLRLLGPLALAPAGGARAAAGLPPAVLPRAVALLQAHRFSVDVADE